MIPEKETSRGPIVAAVDASPSGELAWTEAVARAERDRVRLIAIRVVPELVGVNALFPHLSQGQIERSAIQGADVRDHLDRLAASAGAVDVATVIAHGDPAVEIVRIAEERGASLVVLGDAVRRPRSRLGAIADRVIRHAHCAVLIARRRPPTGIVVGGTDFSDGALPVVVAIGREASNRVAGAAILVHAVDPVPWFDVSPYAPPAVIPYVDAIGVMRAATAQLRRALELHGVSGEAVVVEGSAGPALVTAAANLDAELLVVGTIGRTGMPRLLLGNVAEYVAVRTDCSVLVVRLHRS